MNLVAASTYILKRLETELSPRLYYHSLSHTLDVVDSVRRIGAAELLSDHDMKLALTAAYYHDSGFLFNAHAGHEEKSCQLAAEHLPRFGYSTKDIETILGMIRSTKIPQSPACHLDQILCDADLDYLGRDDFFSIGDTLFKELQSFGQLTDEKTWNRLQVSFIGAHSYFTATNKREREPLKCDHLDELIMVIERYEE